MDKGTLVSIAPDVKTHLAHVTSDVTIGPRTTIWQFASVIRGAVIGSDCNIGSGSIIDGSIIGDHCSIGHGCSINPGTRIGNNVFIGPGVMICNDRWPRVSKQGFDIGALFSGEFVTVLIEDEANIGAAVTILPGVTIGHGSIIAAGSVVEKSVKPEHIYWRDKNCTPIKGGMVNRMKRAAPYA